MKIAVLFLLCSVGCHRQSVVSTDNYRKHVNENGIETWYWMQTKPTTQAGVCAAMFGSDRPYHYAEDGRTQVPGVLWVIDWVDFDKQALLEHQFGTRKDAEAFAEHKCPTKPHSAE